MEGCCTCCVAERKEEIEKSKRIERERDALLKEMDELKHSFSLDVVSTTADVKVSNCGTCVKKMCIGARL